MLNETANNNTLIHEGFNSDFRLALQRELIRRCKLNPKYSLRAFARFLGLESSRLSKILRGERPVSPNLIEQLGKQLGLSPQELQGYVSAARAKKSGLTKPLTDSPERLRFLQLSQDTFEAIEDWHHYAILELMKVAAFKTEPKWLAQALGISVSEVRACIERLQRVGLLEIKPDGSWHDRSEGFSTHILGENESTIAHRRSQKKLLELAIDALEKTVIEKRDQSSMMMATSSSKIAEAKKRIRAFRQELCDFLEDSEEKDTVYQLAISVFPLTESIKNVNPDKTKKRSKK